MSQPKALVCGAGGFIGGHLVARLKQMGYWVRGVDLKLHEFKDSDADEFIQGDLRDPKFVASVITSDLTEIYQLAADMGGAQYLFTGENDANVMHNSVLINLNVLNHCKHLGNGIKVFYSSSACVYPEYNQLDPNNPKCAEDTVYPAEPDSEYGWEKLFSERMYLTFARNYGINVRIARFHNIFGPYGTWKGGREKAPAAICRKVAMASANSSIEIFGGVQTRSFLYIDECIEGVIRLMQSDCTEPVNIGSDELISIQDFATMIISISGKPLSINSVAGPIGVNGRNSDNELIYSKLRWKPSQPLKVGIEKTYQWISQQITPSHT